jgi:hypothetical protein
VDYTIDVSYCYTIFKFVPREEKKNWAALPLINIYFSLAPLPEFPGQKYKKKNEKVCGKTSFI